MNNAELHIDIDRPQYNPINGRFLKGHTSYNKGKKWDEYVSKRSQKRMAKGWENLKKFRPKTRSPLAGNQPKEVVAVSNSGKWIVFPSTEAAAIWVDGIHQSVSRCCRENKRRVSPFGKENTDHRYKGIRFYFETDDIWMSKVNNESNC